MYDEVINLQKKPTTKNLPIKGYFFTLSDLTTKYSIGNIGDSAVVGNNIYSRDGTNWIDTGILFTEVTIYGKTSDTTYQSPRIDSITHTLQTIDYSHHEIHSGSHYFICDYDDNIAINETISFVVTTPNTTQRTHLLLNFSSILGASLNVYEGASNIVGGTAVVPLNSNRNSINTSNLTILKDPISITTGTKIVGFLAGANRSSGAVSRENELILKQNTIYLFRFTSLANSNAISFCGEWYEHTNKVND